MGLHPLSRKSTQILQNHQLELVDEIQPKTGMVILQPVVMKVPNSYGVYSPSKLMPTRTISYEKFLSHYSKHPKGLLICFDDVPNLDTILLGTELVTAYSYCLGCWYIVVSSDVEGVWSKG